MLATGELVALLYPALLVIVLTLLLGRVFCGWICPLGTLIDGTDHLIGPPRAGRHKLRFLKYAILVFVLTGSLFGVQLIGFVDPFSILVRGLSFAVDPGINYVVSSGFDQLYFHAPPWLSGPGETVYAFLRQYVLPFEQHLYRLPLFSLVLLFAVFVLSRFGKRFWCRNCCPLGALLAIFARLSPLRRFPAASCKDCQNCAVFCRMDAFGEQNGRLLHEECNLCMDCIADCSNQPARFRWQRPRHQVPISLSRRSLLFSAALGVSLPVLTRIDAAARLPKPYLLRPPGALEEAEFLEKCVRCGECMKVCIQNALQPCLFEAGYEGMFTPKLIPRLGYCEYNCTLCGQVCPTGAIRQLSLAGKHAAVIGVAFFDTNGCLPYAEQKACIVCEEHCPTGNKAIKFREKKVRSGEAGERIVFEPYIVQNLCIGCGICEKVCPVAGEAAVRVMRTGATPDIDGYG
jgi:polyferredoxin